MAPDFYAEAEHIAQALLAEGLVNEAWLLRRAVESGCTGSEILGGLRLHLQNVYLGRVRNESTKRRMSELLAELDKALFQ